MDVTIDVTIAEPMKLFQVKSSEKLIHECVRMVATRIINPNKPATAANVVIILADSTMI